MNRIAVLEVFGEFDYVTYYTIRLVEDDDVKHKLSEAEKFFEIYDNVEHPNYQEFDVIVRIIDAIGYSEYGAESSLFRFEDAAHALPPKRGAAKRILDIEVVLHSELRIYCIRLTNEVVILLNGGVKTADQALNCPNVREHFKLAQAIAKAVDEALLNGDIKVTGKEIINETGENEIFLEFK